MWVLLHNAIVDHLLDAVKPERIDVEKELSKASVGFLSDVPSCSFLMFLRFEMGRSVVDTDIGVACVTMPTLFPPLGLNSWIIFTHPLSP